MSGDGIEHKVKCKLQWSLNVGGNDDVSYQLPRSSNASLALLEDQCCRVPTYGFDNSNFWTENFVEVAIFLASNSKNRIELTVHDPKENISTCYQLEINDDVIKMELIALPPGNIHRKVNDEDVSNNHRAFGVLLVLATSEGISIFSLVFTNPDATNFGMSECLELSDFESTGPNLTSLKDRWVRQIKSNVVFTKGRGSGTQDEDHIQLPTLVVVASSLHAKYRIPPATQTQISSSNVDALFFYIRDHENPVFRHRSSKGSAVSRRRSCNSLALLRDVGRVVDVAFLGDKLRDKESSLIISILSAGELKLIPISMYGLRKPQNLKVQTVILTGICAHPSLSGLGEACLVESNDTGSCHSTPSVAILCRPKINEIGFKATPNDALLSARKTVSFSPVEVIQEASSGNRRFFPSNDATPITKNPGKYALGSEEQEGLKSNLPGKAQETNEASLISPDSASEAAQSAKEASQESAAVPPVELCSAVDTSLLSVELAEAIQTPLPESKEDLSAISSLNNVSAATASPLVGIQLLDTSCLKDRPSLQRDTSLGSQVLDLTGKFAASDETATSLLSPLSGLQLDDSDESREESSDNSVQIQSSSRSQVDGKYSPFTPVNVQRSDLGIRSALKSIQRTSFLKKETRATTTNRDHLPHVIFVTVERSQLESEKGTEKGGNHCRVNISSVAIPVPEATLESASMKWDALHPKLFVAIHSKSSIRLAEISCVQGEKLSKVDAVTSCSIGPILKELELAKAASQYRTKAISVVRKQGCPSDMEVRLLLCRQSKSSGRAIPDTPINMSSIENSDVRLACVDLPLGRRGSACAKANGPGVKEDKSTALLLEKLNEMMAFMHRFEDKVDSGMSNLEKRIGVIEEAMRTV